MLRTSEFIMLYMNSIAFRAVDDQWETSGPTEMESHVVQDLGLSKADLVEMTNVRMW